MAGVVHIENFGIKPTALEAINNNFEYLRQLAEAGGNEELVQKIGELESKVTKLVADYTLLNDSVTALTATVNETREGMQTISSTITALNPIVQENKTKVAQHSTDIADLKTRVAALETSAPTRSIV